MTRLLLATRNTKKLAEMQRILGDQVTVLGLAKVPQFAEEPEVGATFEDNALAKAVQAARETGEISLADDSGFCVDALNQMPGVLSARWAGTHGNDEANNALLLAQIADVPDWRRTAGFVCALAVAAPSGERHVVRAEWRGTVLREARGHNGFGYDPLFLPADGGGLTSSEMPPAIKDELSHRGQAIALLLPTLRSVLSRPATRAGATG